MTYRVLSLFFIVGCTLFGLWWCALPAVLVYMFLYNGAELVVAALFVDAMFGASATLPYYLLGTSALYLFLMWLKPRFMFYTEQL